MTLTIIADIGSNYTCEQDILEAIAPVKKAGADIFKLQYFNHRDLYGFPAVHQEMPKLNLEKIALACQAEGIEMMCSVFNERDVAYVDRYVQRHKIASAEATHPVLLQTVAATGKPVIISTGCLNEDDFKEIFRIINHKNTIVMYCESEYPARNVDLGFLCNLMTIKDKNSFDFYLGFSDHCFDIHQTSRIAVSRYRVKTLEKHVYHRKVLGPDMGHSISTDELEEYCKRCRHHENGFDDLWLFLNDKDFVRRPIATQHIDSWQKLEYGKNWGFYRSKASDLVPCDNFDFMAIYRSNNMIANHIIMAGEPIYLHNVRLVPKD